MPYIEVIRQNEETDAAIGPTLDIEIYCPADCNNVSKLTVPAAGYFAWCTGSFVQKAFPNLSADERELFISGYCATHDPFQFFTVNDEPVGGN